MKDSLFIGIDPGWKNLGWGIVDSEGKSVRSGTFNPSEYPVGTFPSVLLAEIKEEAPYLRGASMERYVTYVGKHNPDSEHILLVTGALQYMILGQLCIPLGMYKAIDWKTAVSKLIYREYGKENPSDRLDKVFSMFAAETLTESTYPVDHEADASCLAWLARTAWRRSNGVR